MALPKIDNPTYTLELPSTAEVIKYRPFLVKEQKVLMLAQQSDKAVDRNNAIVQIIESCTFGKVTDKNPLFDIEYVFLKLRSKSAGEKIKLNVSDPDDETFSVEHEINIDKIGVEKNKDHTDMIELSENITIKMRYPDITFFNEGVNTGTITETTGLIAKCVSQLVIEEEVYNREDMAAGELEDWLDELTTEQFSKISKFFETMPKLKHSFTLKNTKTGNDFTITLEGLADFF